MMQRDEIRARTSLPDAEREATASKRNRWPRLLSILLVVLVVLVAIGAALVTNLIPAADYTGIQIRTAAIILVGSYLALALGRIPGLQIDRAGIALVGAGLMVASGALSLEEAYAAVDAAASAMPIPPGCQ
jgi:membrane protease YdiL (CAAX protease family)